MLNRKTLAIKARKCILWPALLFRTIVSKTRVVKSQGSGQTTEEKSELKSWLRFDTYFFDKLFPVLLNSAVTVFASVYISAGYVQSLLNQNPRATVAVLDVTYTHADVPPKSFGTLTGLNTISYDVGLMTLNDGNRTSIVTGIDVRVACLSDTQPHPYMSDADAGESLIQRKIKFDEMPRYSGKQVSGWIRASLEKSDYLPPQIIKAGDSVIVHVKGTRAYQCVPTPANQAGPASHRVLLVLQASYYDISGQLKFGTIPTAIIEIGKHSAAGESQPPDDVHHSNDLLPLIR